jgi:hypothetical protein
MGKDFLEPRFARMPPPLCTPSALDDATFRNSPVGTAVAMGMVTVEAPILSQVTPAEGSKVA